MRKQDFLRTTGFAICLLFGSAAVVADDKKDIESGVTQALQQFGALDPAFVRLAKAAAGILVFPHVSKGLAMAGDAFGEGALRANGKTVAFYSITAPSVGLSASAGAPRCDMIFFLTTAALDQFTAKVQWYIDSTEATGTVGRVGRTHYLRETLQRHVLGFMVTEDYLTADVSLKGSKLEKLPP